VKSYLKNKVGIVVHISNPSYLAREGERIAVQSLPGQKCKALSEKQN
jgi:hypothetical protein